MDVKTRQERRGDDAPKYMCFTKSTYFSFFFSFGGVNTGGRKRIDPTSFQSVAFVTQEASKLPK